MTMDKLLLLDRKMSGTWRIYKEYLRDRFEEDDYEKGIRAFEKLNFIGNIREMPMEEDGGEILMIAAAHYASAGNLEQALKILRTAQMYGHNVPYYYSEESIPQDRLYLADKVARAFFHPYFIENHAPVRPSFIPGHNIEETPLSYLEKEELTTKKQRCEISRKPLQKGDSVYRYRLFTGARDFNGDLYAGAEAFENSEHAMKNKEKYETNSYMLEEYNFATDYGLPWMSFFWNTLPEFDLYNTLQTIASPPSGPTAFCCNSIVEKKEWRVLEDTPVNSGSGGAFVELLYVLIKCGYLQQIISLLPQLPPHMPYLLLLFQSEEVRKGVGKYLNNEAHGAMIDLACRQYSGKDGKTVLHLIRYGEEHPDFLEHLGTCLNRYEIHVFDEYTHNPNWAIKEFSYIQRAKSGGLLDFFISDISPLPMLVSMVEEMGMPTAESRRISIDRLSYTIPHLCRTVTLHLAYTHSGKLGPWLDGMEEHAGEMTEKVHKKTMKVMREIQKYNHI